MSSEDQATASTDDDEARLNYRRERWSRRLLMCLAHGRPLADLFGIGDEACVRLTAMLDHIGSMDPGQLIHPSQRHGSLARRALRMLAGCLLPEQPEQALAAQVHAIVDNPHLSVADMHEVLFGRGTGRYPEVTVATFRAIAANLRAGMGMDEAATEAGVAPKYGSRVATFLGWTQYRRDLALDHAIANLDSGRLVRELAAEVGIPRRSMQDLMVKARQLAAEGLA